MKNGFKPEFFKANRQKLRQSFEGTAPIIIAGNGLVQRTRQDDAYDFHQDGDFWYLTGIDEPNFVLVIDKDKDYLIGPETDDYWRTFHGGIDLERPMKISSVDEVLPGDAGWLKLSKRLKKSRHAATLIPPKAFDQRYQVYSNPAKRRLVRLLKTHNPDLQLIDVSRHLADLRTVKQPVEVKAIERTIVETYEAFEVIGRNLKNFKNEREISAEIDYVFAKKGLKHSFRQIIASGQNAITLHYHANDSSINPSKVLLIDMGASLNGYCSDLTRTVSLSPVKRQLEVYEAVLQVQQFALKMLRPGVQLPSYEAAIEHYMGEKLRELGLIKTIDTKAVRKYYPHNTSHFLGIDVHEVGDYQKPLQPGTVLTVEPGIYIPEESIGIRIEDDVVITEAGNRVLSGGLSRDLGSLTIE